ncbi:tryptophan--tRNA ligase [Entomospira culicis]|uniref:Tryptophan--tRNA ligase n=1 Tax=Entomospira culicis TaxID=2719989 RepID=A0A968KVG8_9SPIO|nr:tryptophan--tRNA ligase [Entomospira culicis]NIZ18883.1 tryptophan--tRNA ligase [Entomospira culicis]NIZ69098.1 tryptophan--tRNA ligase [Entomospira culicis]WDI37685.1 tryptophan--tRNA ligase [Entomospira culicis]WDI39313.1 tryptophan--tRNA ligase [Entomospira culicis]
MRKRTLTGIKPTGEMHLGNYLGAIRPALALAEEHDAYYFIADYHALNGIKDANALRDYAKSVAAAWLACGLNPTNTCFYRQSDVPEVHELTTMLMAFSAKGLLNRAHAYKSAVEQNIMDNRDPDYHINMGLYTYPVLMAADILIAQADLVPVGYDQKQHIEMARDIAEAFNHAYGEELLKLPSPYFAQQSQVVVGLDGRKMSKSYGNVIPLFASDSQLKKLVNRIQTNSQSIDEVKDPDQCNVFSLYKSFANAQEIEALAERYRQPGMGWGEAKQALFLRLNEELTPIREQYAYWMAYPEKMEEILMDGASRVRALAQEQILRLKEATGLR